MKMITLNQTDRARQAATLVSEHCHESHRGAMRYRPADTGGTFCIALFGNDGYGKRPDSDPVIHARTKAYVHNLYAGLANLLPEGAVEFGTDEHGSTWVILANFPRHADHDDYRDDYQEQDSDDGEDADDGADDDAMVSFWNDIVWKQWQSQLSYTTE